jgi:hypothetical protein
MSPREYLIDRFRSDEHTLRERAAALRTGAPQPGPDAAMSLRMADACAAVIGMIDAIPDHVEAEPMLGALEALIPLLDQRAAGVASAPPVRAVYVGASTRIREIAEAERQHQRDAAPADTEIDSDDVDIDEIDSDEIDSDDEDDAEHGA